VSATPETATAPEGAATDSIQAIEAEPRAEKSLSRHFTGPSRRHPSILVTDDLLLRTDVSPGARLVTAAILRAKRNGSAPSTRDLARFLRARRDNITEWTREAQAGGLLSVESGQARKRPGAKYYPTNRYRVEPIADPRRLGARFVSLDLTPALGKSPGQRLLRAYLLREQRIAGAVQLPLSIAARAAGMTLDAEKKARQRWIRAGEMEKLYEADRRHPATYVLASQTHAADLDRFNPDKRRLRSVALGNHHRLTVWGTRAQHGHLGIFIPNDNIYTRELARAFPAGHPPVDAREAMHIIDTLDWDDLFRCAHEARTASINGAVDFGLQETTGGH
jgi:hypothetical protein